MIMNRIKNRIITYGDTNRIVNRIMYKIMNIRLSLVQKQLLYYSQDWEKQKQRRATNCETKKTKLSNNFQIVSLTFERTALDTSVQLHSF